MYSTKKNSREVEHIIGEEMIKTFTCVFGNNNSKIMRENLFGNSFIRKLWGEVAKKLKYEFVFEKISS